VRDMAIIASELGIDLYLVARRQGGVACKDAAIYENVRCVESLSELAQFIPSNAKILVLETYASRLLNETRICSIQDVCFIVVGAEDYGVPREVLDRLPGDKFLVKIPVAVEGSSYNVVASLVMALYQVSSWMKQRELE